MTRVKFCGLSRPCDIETANELRPDYIGFVFAPKSRRYVTVETAAELKSLLAPGIPAVGVFVDENPEMIAALLESGVIDLAQLHGRESEEYLKELRKHTEKPVIRAFRVTSAGDIREAEESSADYILLDSGAGSGTAFNWELLKGIKRPYFLAGGLHPGNVSEAVRALRPFAVDVSSGIETGGKKDPLKMEAFIKAVRKPE